MAAPADPRMRVSVLGPVQVWDGDRAVDLGTPRQRSIIAALALSPGRTVPLETLVTRVWGTSAPATAVSTLQRYVAALRRALEPQRAAHETPTVIVTDGGGYALRIPGPGRDVTRLESTVAEAKTLVSNVPDTLRPQVSPEHAAGVARAAEIVQDALALWRGQPYAELGEDPDADAERARLEDLRTTAQGLRAVALLALGRHADAVGELESMIALHPLQERWWALYSVALVRSGRQGQALTALGTLRSLLADELGVDPSEPLRDLHTAILRQDPSLDWAGPTPRGTAPTGPPFTPRWPLAGRTTELAALTGLVDAARQHRPGAALVAGEAGVGKTRLVQEVAVLAHRCGFTVAVAGCSQQSPPTLWPIRVALTALARQLPSFEADVAPLDARPEELSTREHVVDSLLRACDDAPLLLVVEDVQWADAVTLQALEDLIGRRGTARLMLLLTRRTGAGDDARMGRLAASVAGAEGPLIDLTGLSLDETTALVRSVDGSLDDVRTLWERSSGNPFFLTELALPDGAWSGSLTNVVRAHVLSLPPMTISALRAASVLDVSFDIRLLALMLDRAEPETLALLAPAIRTGLVVEHGDGTSTHAFTHAVVREVLYADQSPVARSTWHTAAGRALSDHGELERVDQRACLAHHWDRAERGAAGDAWRAVLDAAAHARTRAAYAEEARHLRLAARLLETDAEAGDRERFELLILLIDACRWSGDWCGVSDVVDAAIAVAERLGDDGLAARAAISAAEGALWQVRAFGHVHAPIVDALERLLSRLDDRETSLRCRAQLALAMELYYDPDQTDRIDALADEAVRLAEQTGDLRLRFAAYHGAFVSTWRLETVERRSAIAERAVDVARRLDDPRALVFAETLSLAAASELGDAERVGAGVDRVIETARCRGLTTPEGVLRVLALGWAALRGDGAAAATQSTVLGRLARDARLPNFLAAVGGTVITAALLSGDPEALQAAAAEFVPGEDVPTDLFGADLLIRLGRLDAARALLEDTDVDLATHTFMGPVNAALACRAAVATGPTRLTEDAYTYLRSHAGRMCSAGAATIVGPVDLYLAVGAKALGDQAAAERHLDDAGRLVGDWSVPGLRGELDEVRDLVLGATGAS